MQYDNHTEVFFMKPIIQAVINTIVFLVVYLLMYCVIFRNGFDIPGILIPTAIFFVVNYIAVAMRKK